MTANLILVAFGGAAGSVLRYLTVIGVNRALPGFPWGTLCVNVLGSALMGAVAVLLLERAEGSWARLGPLLMAGLLGGFTTFSAFSLDAVGLIERGRLAAAGAYMAGSVLLSITALWAGIGGARALWGDGA